MNNHIPLPRADQAWTGSRMINMLDPNPDDILLSEVAAGLSRENRYGGNTTSIPWSVAQHCLLCDHFAEEDGVSSPEMRAAILLHDAPEYMLRDVLAPLKRFLPDYLRIEGIWERAVATRFGIPNPLPSVVKTYDMLAASSEKALLIAPEAGDWPNLPWPRNIPVDLLGLSPLPAASLFERTVQHWLRRCGSRESPLEN